MSKHTLCLVLCVMWVVTHAKLQWQEINPNHEAVYTTEANAHPAARYAHALFCDGPNVYVFGGVNNEGEKRDFWKYESATRRWLWLSDGSGPVGRSHMAYWTLYNETDTAFYMYGGSTRNLGALGDLWHYVKVAREWKPLSNGDGPGARWGSITWIDAMRQRLFLYGGRRASQLLSDLWHYDLNTFSWHAHPESSDPGPLAFGAAVSLNDTVYLFGGQTNASTQSVSARFWKLNLQSLIWTEQEMPQDVQIPEARQEFTFATIPNENALLLMHGRHGARVFGEAIWKLSLGDHTWTRDTSQVFPARRYAAGYCINVNHSLVVSGGAYNGVQYSNDVWEYAQRSAFATVLNIFKFDLNYTNTAASYLVAMTTLLLVFAIAFSIASCVYHCKRKREKTQFPLHIVDSDF